MKLMIKDIKSNKLITSYFLLESFQLKKKKNNEDYLVFNLKDKTGSIKGFIWNVTQDLTESLIEKSILKITGYTKILGDSLVIDVLDWRYAEKSEVNLSDFLGVVKEGIDYWYSKLIENIKLIKDSNCRSLIHEFLKDEIFMKLFKIMPAGMSVHHNYIGGLMEHTVSTMNLSADFADRYRDILNKDILLTGAFLHDIGKTRELKLNMEIEYSIEGELLGHITMGILMLKKRIDKIDKFPHELALQLYHIILSHHGKLEYGSPVAPKTPEAIVLSILEGADARINHLNGFLKNSNEFNKWSKYDKYLDTRILLERIYIAESINSEYARG